MICSWSRPFLIILVSISLFSLYVSVMVQAESEMVGILCSFIPLLQAPMSLLSYLTLHWSFLIFRLKDNNVWNTIQGLTKSTLKNQDSSTSKCYGRIKLLNVNSSYYEIFFRILWTIKTKLCILVSLSSPKIRVNIFLLR